MTSPAVVTATLNPAIDQTLIIPGFAAGKVNRVADSRSHAGGKGVNVACVLADLGIGVAATGFLGSINPQLFEQTFQQKGIEDRFIRIDGATRTGIKIVDPGTQETTDVNFPGLMPRPEDVAQLFEQISGLGAPGRWFVLSGSVPAGLPEDVYARLIHSIHEHGGHVLLDTSGPPLRQALEKIPDAMKPNADELSDLVGRSLDTSADVCAAALSLLDRGVRRVVVSMGGEGAVFVERGAALLARPPRVTVRSTVGAGDAMVAGLVAAMLQDLPLDETARRATAHGAYAVTRLGAGIDDPAALRALAGQVEIERLE
jgi:1-phosphofructokinase